MSFTKNSEKLIKEFIGDFEKYCKKKSKATQRRTDNILKTVYNDIKLSSNFVELLDEKNLLKIDTKQIKSLHELPKSELMDSQFMPGSIKDDILYNILGFMKLSTVISGIKINIYYGIFKKSDFNKLSKLKAKLKDALRYVKFCCSNATLKSIKTLDIYLYLTSAEKKVPKNQVLVLGSNNCNSAVTYACATNGKLMIYREEEWKKVLVHELFHSLCLDFSSVKYEDLKKKMKKLFDVKSDFEISECYTEFWATIVNSCFISYDLLDDVNDIDNFLLFTDFCIQLERIFAIFQMVKVLHFMGLRYENLYKVDAVSTSFRKVLYKEDTNVLSYYILKTILLFNNDDFLRWCFIYNNNIVRFDKTQVNFNKFYEFIKTHYNSNFFIESINKMELHYRKIRGPYSKYPKTFILTTSRMTICEN
tara:strand:- start:7445 stop:8704 length:1260 start_codon:yes stop_codon:yes gene_type:complete